MHEQHDVVTRMEEIRNTFLLARNFSASGIVDDVLKSIHKVNPEYRPVAQEGAAMELALRDFSNKGNLSLWNSLVMGSEPYLISHAHIGLGWATANQESSPLPVLQGMQSMMKFYFYDGWGYYDGTFKQRHAIRSRQIPTNLEEDHKHAYNQGIGRSIWYSCKGVADKAKEVINGFPVERRKDLWRGVGIACSFVGGTDAGTQIKLLECADTFKNQLVAGAGLVVRTRFMSGYVPTDLDLICQNWCNKSASEVASVVSNAESAIPFDETSQMLLISQLENKL